MKWNWQKSDWPNFTYNSKDLSALEAEFLKQSGLLLGVFKHLNTQDEQELTIDLVSSEALKTSEIEGEILNRDSLRSSIQKHFGLKVPKGKIPPAEEGVSQMMMDLYIHFSKPLNHKRVCDWNKMLLGASHKGSVTGKYRSHREPMQIVSGSLQKPIIHFEAPPSAQVKNEMSGFFEWFKNSAPTMSEPLPYLTRAGIAHLYFVAIHPFEDGNGRIGRAVSEKVFAESLGRPTLIALSYAIEKNKKKYYEALHSTNHSLKIDNWLNCFAEITLEAIAHTQGRVEFLISKSKFFDNFKESLNTRQEKVLLRMFKEGPEGFEGGLSAENYINISKTSRATATRDLQALVNLKALTKKGELRHTRYFLNLKI
jgi:Fic family protein